MNENGNSNEYTFVCPRCGNDVKSSSRYCMKCGYLNPNHPDNKQMEKFMPTGMQSYSVSEAGVNTAFQANNNEVRGSIETAFGSHMGSFTLCFIVNFICWFALLIALLVSFYYVAGQNIYMMLSSELSYALLGTALFSMIQYGTELAYMKMNKRWWYSLIPFLNLYHLSDAINEKKLLNFLIFVPVIGQIYLLTVYYKLGKDFKTNGLLTMLFPFIMIPMIGFGSNAFRGVCYLSGRDSLEQEYGKKKFFLVTCVIAIISSIVIFIYANTVNISKGADRLSSYYLYFASQRVIRRTKLKVESHIYECDHVEGDTLYFYFQDLDDYFSIPFYVYRNPIKAYVKVVVHRDEEGVFNTFNKYDYYISMTDREYGYEEINVQDLKIEDIKEYTELDKSYEAGNQCYFKRTA